MKKYFLKPSWDVIPHLDSLEFICGGVNKAFPLPAGVTYKIVNPLLRGATFWNLTMKAPVAAVTQLLQQLRKAGIVEYREVIKKDTLSTRSYLDLLKQACLGDGKVLSHLWTPPITSGGLSIFYAHGFAPTCIPGQSTFSGGWGADPDPDMAAIKAIVEGVERYALANYDSTVQTKTLTQIKGSDTISIPIDALHHPVNYTELGRSPIAPLNISGVAGHQSIEAAMVNASLELCEHEALMVAWFGNRTCPTIRVSSLDGDLQKYIRQAKKLGWNIILKDISLDLVPVVMAVGLGPKNKRALTIGSCAAFSSRYASRKALSEVLRTILVDEAVGPVFPNLDEQQVNDIATHGYFYAHHAHLHRMKRLWEGGELINASSQLTHGSREDLTLATARWEQQGAIENSELSYLIDEVFAPAGIKLYWDNITPTEIINENIPLYIVRAYAPEMARLTVGFKQEPETTKRYSRLLDRFGNRKKVEKDLHPFS